MERASRRIRELAQRNVGGTSVTLLWLEGTERVWIQIDEPAHEDFLAVTVDPRRALDAFYHPYAYLLQHAA